MKWWSRSVRLKREQMQRNYRKQIRSQTENNDTRER
jgi:hypothetical protein